MQTATWWRRWTTGKRDRSPKAAQPSAVRARGRTEVAAAARELWCESLETRVMYSAEYRTLDGTGNNLTHLEWGSTAEQMLRQVPAEYADGVSAPAGNNRPSARAISNAVVAQGNIEIFNDRYLSALVYAWGQFLDHDFVLTETASPSESFPVAVPSGDPFFDPTSSGTATIPLARSKYDPTTGTSAANPRQQVNTNTAFIDASQVYGSDPVRAAALRTFQGGKLKTSTGNLLPKNTFGLPNQIPPGAEPPNFFIAGDVRANENVELTALHTLFVREHNYWASRLAFRYQNWSDEQLYLQARRIVGAEIQAITYNEYLPALLGHPLQPYQGYDPNVNPGIRNEFATAAYRFGHSMLAPDVEFLNNMGNRIRPPIELKQAFFNPAIVTQYGIDGMLKYLASTASQEIDVRVVDDLRNFLFGPPGAGGMDLPSLNIQRGRDHGLADYNATRVAYGLPPVTSFAEITSNVQLQQQLASVYASVEEIDLWVGGLAEDHQPGSSFGPLFHRIIEEQFEQLRAGDRFWYEHDFAGAGLTGIQQTTLAKILRRNTALYNLQDNVFEFRVDIQGVVVNDLNQDGVLAGNEPRLSGVTVQLLDARGFQWGSATTDENGFYRFTGMPLGQYQLRMVVPSGMQLTASPPATTFVSKGGVIDGMNFGLASLTDSLGLFAGESNSTTLTKTKAVRNPLVLAWPAV